MLIKGEAAAEWQQKPRPSGVICQDCGMQPADGYRRVNGSPRRIRLRRYCPTAPERVAGLMIETPEAGRHCAPRLATRQRPTVNHLRPTPMPGRRLCCGAPVNRQPAAAIAALPPPAPDLRPGEIRVRYAAPAPWLPSKCYRTRHKATILPHRQPDKPSAAAVY